MTISLLLPCVRFKARLLPQDWRRPTDLEQAILYYILSLNEGTGAHLHDLQRFTGLGKALLTDTLIAFVNRRWVDMDEAGLLRVSEKAESALATEKEIEAGKLPTLERGMEFSLCYDLVGGGVAHFDERFLSRNSDQKNSIPPTYAGRYGNRTETWAPGRPLDGYIDDADIERKALNALRTHKKAKDYLQHRETTFSVYIEPPARPLEASRDVMFYDVNFRVFLTMARAAEDTEEDAGTLRLECNHRRHSGSARLGRLNANSIVEIASRAEAQGDPRLQRHLTENAEQTDVEYSSTTSSLERLLTVCENPFDAHPNELEDLWSEAMDEVAEVLSNQLDIEASGVFRPSDDALRDLLSKAQDRLMLSSRLISVTRREQENRPMKFLRDMGSHRRDFRGIVTTLENSENMQQQQGIEAVLDVLGAEGLDAQPRSHPHIATPIALADGNTIALFDSQPLANRAPGALVLRGPRPVDGRERGLLRTVQSFLAGLPTALNEKLQSDGSLSLPREGRPPAEVAELLVTIGADLHLARSDADGGDMDVEAAAARDDLLAQVRWLDDWTKKYSESFSILVDEQITDAALGLMGLTTPGDALAIGIAGLQDASAMRALPRRIRDRLVGEGVGGRVVVGLPPEGEDQRFDDARHEISGDFSSLGIEDTAGHRIIDMVRSENGVYRPGFVAGPFSIVIARDRLIATGSRRRRPGGMEVGLLLRGTRARQLGLSFLERFYPGLTEALPSVHRPGPRPRSDVERRRLISLWPDWQHDGNRGATRAREWLEDQGLISRAHRSRDPRLIAGLLPEHNHTAQAYAILKAAAIIEHEAEGKDVDDAPVGALTELAAHHASRDRLLPTVILADHLPGSPWLREPLARKLAFCLARRVPPILTADEIASLHKGGDVAATLACLLMLEGLGADLPSWLPYSESPALPHGSPLNALTKALTRVAEPDRLLDVSGDDGQEGKTLPEVCAELKEKIDNLRMRARVAKGVAKSVQALREQLFLLEGSFFVELSEILADWDPRNRKVPLRLVRLLRGDSGDLGIDLLGASSAGSLTIDPNTTARDYWTLAHERMQQRTLLGPVLQHLTGRDARTACDTLFNLILKRLVPLLTDDTPNEAMLREAVVRFRTAHDREPPEHASIADEGWATALLMRRFDDVHATRNVSEDPWLMPDVRNDLTVPGRWIEMEQAFLRSEFSLETRFRDVATWYLRDNKGHGDILIERRLDFYDHIMRKDDHREDALSALHAFLKASLEKQRRLVDAWAGVVDTLGDPTLAVQVADLLETCGDMADCLGRARTSDEDAIMPLELESAILLDVDLSSKVPKFQTALAASLENFRKNVCAGMPERDPRRAPIDAAFRSVMKNPENALRTITGIDAYLDMRDELARTNIECAPSFFVGSSRDPGAYRNDPVHGGATDLLDLIEHTREGTRAAPSAMEASAVARAVSAYFSLLPDERRQAVARLRNDVWEVSWPDEGAAKLSFQPGTRVLRILLPVTPQAENREGSREHEEPDDTFTLLLAPALTDLKGSVAILERRRIHLGATVQPVDRRLFLAYVLSERQRLRGRALRAWWERISIGDRASTARFLDDLLVEGKPGTSLPLRAARFCIAFGEGVIAPKTTSRYTLSEACLFALSTHLKDTMDKGGDLPDLLDSFLKP